MKKIPGIIYHMWLVTILLVCIVSCVGHFNFHGAFFFLHLVNPLVFLVYYMVFIDDVFVFVVCLFVCFLAFSLFWTGHSFLVL